MKGYGITFGALSDHLEVQLQRQGFTLGDNAEKIQRCAVSINYLLIQGILTESESHRARNRLIKQIKRTALPTPTTPPEAK